MAFKFRNHIRTGCSWHELAKESARERASNYVSSSKKVVVSDCDGILTDSKSIYTCDGKFGKIYGAYDKEMMELMLDLGWRFIFVTTDKAGAGITESRLTHLEKLDQKKISHQVLGAHERAELVKKLMDDGNKVLFVGDSLSDIETLNISTWAATTSNAPDIVKDYCDYVSELDGGNGGFADILFAVHNEILNHSSTSRNSFDNV